MKPGEMVNLEPETKIHNLKIRKEFFDDIVMGRKSFEIRFNDRGYQRGDVLRLIPIIGEKIFANESIDMRVTYVLSGWGLKEDYVALGLGEV